MSADWGAFGIRQTNLPAMSREVIKVSGAKAEPGGRQFQRAFAAFPLTVLHTVMRHSLSCPATALSGGPVPWHECDNRRELIMGDLRVEQLYDEELLRNCGSCGSSTSRAPRSTR